jgi:aspartate 1-decarboxylase
MLLTLCKSKIHRAHVTEANLEYMGSITIAADLMEAAGLLPHERVQVLNLQSGARLETYVIVGERGSGVICLNGPAAHHFQPGDIAIIIAYATMTPDEAREWQPTVVFVDEHNAITRIAREEQPSTLG